MAKKEKIDDKILDVDARMQGTIVFKDPVNLRINGSFEGKLETCGSLTIGENANVRADIQGDKIIIAGKVTGNLTASESIALIPPAVVQGNVLTPILSIAEGAVLDGQLHMLGKQSSEAGGGRTLSLRDVAQYLEVEAKVVEEWANQRKIPAEFQNGEWKFNKVAIEKWLQDEKVKR
ncbi:MAG: polymer-forming cytoskeletal protein [Candidatus Omnitrophica bacterium]|nr:polymer-forming cytoskeletal protein [Candidatus Omnitrophota bacterium]